MAQGSDAVRAALGEEFGAIQISESFEIDKREVLLDFKADGRNFRVWVTYEYDVDYASGHFNVDLKSLGPILRTSTSGKARVTREGIHLRA